MNILQAIFFGILQGVAEFLPVSSSGHLAIFKQIFGLKNVGQSFDVFLHLGTLIAVFVVYWKDIARLIYDGVCIIIDCIYNIRQFILAKKHEAKPQYRRVINTAYKRFALLVIVSTIPTGIIGILNQNLIEKVSDNFPSGQKTPKQTTYLNATFMGVCQGIATLPGLSRSGTTITAGLVCGLRRDFAVKYSFIMSIPAILGAVVVKIPKMKTDIASASVACYLVGIVVSAVIGYICIKTMLVIVRKKKLTYFSIYCGVVGMIAIIASFVTK